MRADGDGTPSGETPAKDAAPRPWLRFAHRIRALAAPGWFRLPAGPIPMELALAGDGARQAKDDVLAGDPDRLDGHRIAPPRLVQHLFDQAFRCRGAGGEAEPPDGGERRPIDGAGAVDEGRAGAAGALG